MLPCLSKKFLGIECPGCGSQRALLMLFKGEFYDAFFMFPAIYTTILFFVLVSLNFIDKSRNYHKSIIISAIANGAIMIISFILKHI